MEMAPQQSVLDLVSLDGKVGVVSGAASGIGLGVVTRLAEAGARVVLLDLNLELGYAAERELTQRGSETRFYDCDVTSDSSCHEAVEQTMVDFGRIDILVNSAGIAVRKNAVDLMEDEWDSAVNVTLKGSYMLSHHVLPHMIASGSGSIINIGSGWSLTGGENAVSYCAAKGGVLNLTRAMAIDHGRHNIRVNCVCPGDIDTPMLRSECEQLGADPEEFMSEAADRPLNRVGTPADVANAVLFFASDMSTWVTGAHLVVDGGGIA
jgi:NAD(P)-dependent dehydrogenase (short-subunit alcohol dehydrogenase family)